MERRDFSPLLVFLTHIALRESQMGDFSEPVRV